MRLFTITAAALALAATSAHAGALYGKSDDFAARHHGLIVDIYKGTVAQACSLRAFDWYAKLERQAMSLVLEDSAREFKDQPDARQEAVSAWQRDAQAAEESARSTATAEDCDALRADRSAMASLDFVAGTPAAAPKAAAAAATKADGDARVASAAVALIQEQASADGRAERSAAESDAELTKLYHQLPRTPALVSSERAWIAYRDTECRYEHHADPSGAMYAGETATCAEAMTRQRIEVLRRAIAENGWDR